MCLMSQLLHDIALSLWLFAKYEVCHTICGATRSNFHGFRLII